ncbi:MAG TPA: C45 family peptidase, partial [Solirubrobacter sp.]
ARTEILAGKGPRTECSVVGQGGLLAQNWDWHPDAAASTVVWIVEHERGWFATLTEAGILGKIGLNDAGLGVCLNLLETTADGGLDGTPIHLLLRRTLQSCRSVDDAVELLTSASTSASSAVTVATPNDVASVELSPGGANVIRGTVGAHTNHFLEPPRRGEDVVPEESPSTIPRLEVVRTQPLLDALRSHESHPKGVCRHLDPTEPWVEQTVTVASVVMNLAARRFHVAAGQPCTHEHVQLALPVAAHA